MAGQIFLLVGERGSERVEDPSVLFNLHVAMRFRMNQPDQRRVTDERPVPELTQRLRRKVQQAQSRGIGVHNFKFLVQHNKSVGHVFEDRSVCDGPQTEKLLTQDDPRGRQTGKNVGKGEDVQSSQRFHAGDIKQCGRQRDTRPDQQRGRLPPKKGGGE